MIHYKFKISNSQFTILFHNENIIRSASNILAEYENCYLKNNKVLENDLSNITFWLKGTGLNNRCRIENKDRSIIIGLFKQYAKNINKQLMYIKKYKYWIIT